MNDNFKNKSKEQYLEYVEVFFENKCKNCTDCKEKKDCKISMLMNGLTTIFGTPSCVCDEEEFKELMTQ